MYNGLAQRVHRGPPELKIESGLARFTPEKKLLTIFTRENDCFFFAPIPRKRDKKEKFFQRVSQQVFRKRRRAKIERSVAVCGLFCRRKDRRSCRLKSFVSKQRGQQHNKNCGREKRPKKASPERKKSFSSRSFPPRRRAGKATFFPEPARRRSPLTPEREELSKEAFGEGEGESPFFLAKHENLGRKKTGQSRFLPRRRRSRRSSAIAGEGSSFLGAGGGGRGGGEEEEDGE